MAASFILSPFGHLTDTAGRADGCPVSEGIAEVGFQGRPVLTNSDVWPVARCIDRSAIATASVAKRPLFPEEVRAKDEERSER